MDSKVQFNSECLHLLRNFFRWKIINLSLSIRQWIYFSIRSAQTHPKICKPLSYILQFSFHFLLQFYSKIIVSVFLIYLNTILTLEFYLNFHYFYFSFPHFLRFRKQWTDGFHEAHHKDFQDIIFKINPVFLKIINSTLFSSKIKFDSSI